MQFNAKPILTAFAITSLFNFGKAPGKATETVDICSFGFAPKAALSDENIFDCVFNCTWISKPDTNSNSVGETAVFVLIYGQYFS
ncbi:hypothetical protein D3C80_1528270 [compost metagenome]